MLRLICGYAQQNGGYLEEESFFDGLRNELDMHSASDLDVCWVTLMDMLVGVLMHFMLFLEGMVQVRGIWNEECY